MISPLCTDEELIRAARFVESPALRTIGERLARRCAQLDTVARLADPQAPDLAQRVAEIRDAARRD